MKEAAILKDGILGNREFYRPIAKEKLYERETVYHKKHVKQDTLESIFSATAMIGDMAVILLVFAAGIGLQLQSVVVPANIQGMSAMTIQNGYKLMLLSSLIVVWGLLRRNLYECKYLLRPDRSLGKFAAAFAICLFTFIGVSIAIHTTPPISRRFIAAVLSLMFLIVYGWRIVLARIMHSQTWRVIGASD